MTYRSVPQCKTEPSSENFEWVTNIRCNLMGWCYQVCIWEQGRAFRCRGRTFLLDLIWNRWCLMVGWVSIVNYSDPAPWLTSWEGVRNKSHQGAKTDSIALHWMKNTCNYNKVACLLPPENLPNADCLLIVSLGSGLYPHGSAELALHGISCWSKFTDDIMMCFAAFVLANTYMLEQRSSLTLVKVDSPRERWQTNLTSGWP